MKLMVIGASGNLGSELRRQSTHAIVPVGRREWEDLAPGDLAGVDVVIHAAADLQTPVREQPLAVLRSGPVLTARLLELMGAHGTPRLMCVSSCAVYGAGPTREDAGTCCPLTLNGQLNLLNESLVEAYCEPRGIQWEIYRLFNTFGGSDRFSVVHRIIAAARQRAVVAVHNGGLSRRDFIHVADAAAILLECAERRPPYAHLNLGTGESTSIGELVATAQAAAPGFEARFDSIPDRVVVSVADTGRLMACTTPRRFTRVLDFLSGELA